MADRAYGTVTKAGMSSKGYGKMDRRGPGKHKRQDSRVNRPNPAGTIRSIGQSVIGPDKGVG